MDQFLQTASTLSDQKSACDLIEKIIDSPNVFSFSDLLEIPLISSMKSHSEYKKFYELVKLFAYGTYLDYIANKSNLPALSENSITKLRHLSIVTLASKCRTIPYQTLSDSLGVKNVRQLEDLIIEAFYSDIIKGKLDQANKHLEIDFAIGRDVTDEQVDDILITLDNWCKNCDIALKTIETQIKSANLHKQANIDYQASIEAEVANLKKSIKLQSQEVDAMNTSSSLRDAKKSAKLKGTKTATATKTFK